MKYCRWKILRSERIRSSIIDAIGSTKNGLSIVEQREGSALSKGTFRSSNFVTERPLFKYHQSEDNKFHTAPTTNQKRL